MAKRDREADLSVEEDVLVTNSFQLMMSGQQYMGLFPELSVSVQTNEQANLEKKIMESANENRE